MCVCVWGEGLQPSPPHGSQRPQRGTGKGSWEEGRGTASREGTFTSWHRRCLWQLHSRLLNMKEYIVTRRSTLSSWPHVTTEREASSPV